MLAQSRCPRPKEDETTPSIPCHRRAATVSAAAAPVLSALLGAALLSATACAPAPRAGTATVMPEVQVKEEAYTTYFGFDSEQLDAEARAVVAEAVASAKASNVQKVVISGHSDSVGAADYNRRLSMARVEAVASEFVDSGLPFSKIEMQVFGEARPKVEAPDGWRAAANRRAEIRVVKMVVAAAPSEESGKAACDYAYIWSGGRAAPVCVEKRTQTLHQPN